MTGAIALLDFGVSGERIGVRPCPAVSGRDAWLSCICPCKRAVHAECLHCYIAVEHRAVQGNDIPFCPNVECRRYRRYPGSRREAAIHGLSSIAIHFGVAVTAIASQPVSHELPIGSEQVVVAEILDEAAFAALMEGTERGKDVPDLKLPVPELPTPLVTSAFEPPKAILAKTEASALEKPTAEAISPPHEAPEIVKPAPPAKPRPIRKKDEILAKNRAKAVAKRGSEDASSGPGRQGAGANRVSSAQSRQGRSGSVEGMAGKAAVADYRAKVIAHLGRYKRYPRSAEPMRLEGRVRISFTINENGMVKTSAISASSGHAVLDRDVLAMLNRAQPFPKMPSGAGGSSITITTQIGYNYPR